VKTVTTPAEWDADPDNETRQRDFDGHNRARHVATLGVQSIARQELMSPASTLDSSPPGLLPLRKHQRKGSSSRAKVLAVLSAVVLAMAVGGCGSNGNGGSGGGAPPSSFATRSSGHEIAHSNGEGGPRPSSFATPSWSQCASIGSGWFGASAAGTGDTVCSLVINDKKGDMMRVYVVNLQPSATEPFSGTTPSLDALIRQDEEEESAGWTERFAIPGYDLAGVSPGGTAEAYAYASDGTVLECQADLEGPEDVGAYRSRCAAAFKVLAPR
jgi:hypothetical protein